MPEQAIEQREPDEAELLAATLEPEPDQSLPVWYLGELTKIDAMAERIREQSARMLAQLETHRRALAFRYGAEFRAQVEADLAAQRGRKKSVDYPTGRAGFRQKPGKLTITDAKALSEWCAEHCMEAMELKIARTTPIREHYERTGELPPGCVYTHPGDEFYPPLNLPRLPDREPDQPPTEEDACPIPPQS